jgi:hypothetical protein
LKFIEIFEIRKLIIFFERRMSMSLVLLKKEKSKEEIRWEKKMELIEIILCIGANAINERSKLPQKLWHKVYHLADRYSRLQEVARIKCGCH